MTRPKRENQNEESDAQVAQAAGWRIGTAFVLAALVLAAAAANALRSTQRIEDAGRQIMADHARITQLSALLVSATETETLRDSVRAAISMLNTEERSVLARERNELDAATRAATRQLVVTAVVGVLLLGLAFGAFLRESRRRRAAGAQVRELNRTLETRIQQVRRDLLRSEARLRQGLDGLLEGCVMLDRDLRYLYANAAAAQQGRTTVDAMVGSTLFEVYPGSEESALVAAMRRTLDLNLASQVELEFVFPDGDSGWFELHLQPVPEGLFLLSIERTSRVRAERSHAATEGSLRALLGSLPEQVFVLDCAGVVLDLHRPVGTVPIAMAHELLGRPLADALGPLPAERLATAIRQVVETGKTQTMQYEAGSVSDRTHFEAVVVPTDGERITVVVRDITARVNLEDQLRQAQKMEAVGQLTGGIAHDFNNVLTIIGSNAELLATDEDRRVGGSVELREIRTATRRGAAMIAQLLSFSRRGLLRREPLEVQAALRDFLTMLQRLMPAHVRLEAGTLACGEAALLDSGALEQVLANLCTNARDAMPEGGTIRVDCAPAVLDARALATHPWIKPGPHVCVSVSDTGMGMDERTRARIFEPFFTTKPTGLGTGLGMSMVYGMMKDHEGMVHVHSQVGKGTVVKLYFPVVVGTPQLAAPRRNSGRVAVVGGTECLLIAEDEPSIRMASRRALESKGYEVLEAADGEQALLQWRQNRDRVALVISDIVMPKLGGVQLAQALRAEGSDVPVIFTSGYASDALSAAGALPADLRFLDKPWTLVQLFTLVRATLDERTEASVREVRSSSPQRRVG